MEGTVLEEDERFAREYIEKHGLYESAEGWIYPREDDIHPMFNNFKDLTIFLKRCRREGSIR